MNSSVMMVIVVISFRHSQTDNVSANQALGCHVDGDAWHLVMMLLLLLLLMMMMIVLDLIIWLRWWEI